MQMTKRPVVLALLALTATLASAQARRRAFVPPAVNNCGPATLASGFSGDIEADDSYVYYADLFNLFRVAKSGGAPQALGSVAEDVASTMAIDDTNLYVFGTDINGLFGTLYAVPKTGGTPMPLVNSVVTPFELYADGTYVYFTTLGTPTGDDFLADGQVIRLKKDGSNVTILARNLNAPTSVAADASNVYFTESGISGANKSSGLRVVAQSGGNVRHLTDDDNAVTLALTATDIVYGTLTLNSTGSLRRIAKGGGTPSTLAGGFDIITKIVPTSDKIYLFNEGDAEWLGVVPAGGGTVTHLVDGSFDTAEFALDDCAVYFVDFQDDVRRVPR
jgi:Domain of unknown function (DUF5050)